MNFLSQILSFRMMILWQNANGNMPLPQTSIQKKAHPNPKTPNTYINDTSYIGVLSMAFWPNTVEW